MKPTELAKLLDISPVTLRRWAGQEYAEFLSSSGAGQNGARRTFDDTDSRILALIAEMKAHNASGKEITLALQSARSENWRNLPPLRGMTGSESVELVSREAVNERLQALRAQYEIVVQERDDLRLRLDTTLHEKSGLQERLTELSEQAAELRGQMQQYTFNGKRLNAAVLVGVALVFGIAVALLTLVIVVLISH